MNLNSYPLKLQHPLLANISFTTLEQIVRWDQKRRFQLIYQPMALSPCSENWWLRVRKGHNEVRYQGYSEPFAV